MEINHLVAIVGPTAVGKSRLAIRLARAFDGEIVNADSRQIYRHMDIGTAKPSPENLAFIPHHLINIVYPDEDFSLAQYQQLACQAIEDIQQRNKLALLVGGSGQYIWSVLEGWGIPKVPPDPEFRHSMEEKVAEFGKEKLYHELMNVAPVTAQRIGQHNVRRIIRALEVYRSTETSPAQLQQKDTSAFNSLVIGLTMDRAELYRRIDLRVDQMIERGFVSEVGKLLKMEYDPNLPAMSSIGYKQIAMFLEGKLALSTAIQQIKFETHRVVRHQNTWFQLKDGRIKWFDIQRNVVSDITTLLAQFIRGK